MFMISHDSNRRREDFNPSGTAIDDCATNPKHEDILLASN